MEARGVRSLLAVALGLLSLVTTGAGYKTPNFIVQAKSPQLAEKIGRMAEKYRHTLAVAWIGKPMPDWSQPCPITVVSGPREGAGGETSFIFDRNQVFGWKMTVRGTEERILDSVLPHEVTHTIFASYFRRPMPRWADEGACTTMEHESERGKQHRLLYEFLRTERGIPFTDMFVMKQYPQDILPLYAQGYSLARYLIQQGGRAKFITFLGEGMEQERWTAAVLKHYGHKSIADLQQTWVAWVESGSPELKTAGLDSREGPPTELVAWNDRESAAGDKVVYRGQSADDTPIASREMAAGMPVAAPAAARLAPLVDRGARDLNDMARVEAGNPAGLPPIEEPTIRTASNDVEGRNPFRNAPLSGAQGGHILPASGGRSIYERNSLTERGDVRPLGQAGDRNSPAAAPSMNPAVAPRMTDSTGSLRKPNASSTHPGTQVLAEWGNQAAPTTDVAW